MSAFFVIRMQRKAANQMRRTSWWSPSSWLTGTYYRPLHAPPWAFETILCLSSPCRRPRFFLVNCTESRAATCPSWACFFQLAILRPHRSPGKWKKGSRLLFALLSRLLRIATDCQNSLSSSFVVACPRTFSRVFLNKFAATFPSTCACVSWNKASLRCGDDSARTFYLAWRIVTSRRNDCSPTVKWKPSQFANGASIDDERHVVVTTT